MPQAASQVGDDLSVVTHAGRWRHSGADALHSTLTGSHRAFALAPAGRGGKYNISQFRRLDSYNTGVQTAHFSSPLRSQETLDLAPEDGRQYNLREGERVRVSSRRGSVIAPVRFDPGLRQGLAFLTMHFPEQVATNDLTIDAVDPKSGTSEFKATAIRIDKCTED